MPQGKCLSEPSKATCMRGSCVTTANRKTKTKQSINLSNFITSVWGQFGRRGEFNCKAPMSRLPEASNWSGKEERQGWLRAETEGWECRQACHHLRLESCRVGYWKVSASDLAFLLWIALNSAEWWPVFHSGIYAYKSKTQEVVVLTTNYIIIWNKGEKKPKIQFLTINS